MTEVRRTNKSERLAARDLTAVTKWREWINGRIRDDVLRLHQQRIVWDGMQQVIRHNADLPRVSVLWEYLFDTYTAAQAAAVRRLTETEDTQVQSLGQLLHQIGAGDQRTVTREWWMSGWPTNWNEEAEGLRLFESVAGAGAAEFPAQKARDDLQRLRATATKVKDFVDRYLAHMDKRGLDVAHLPKVGELHDAIDLIRDLYASYSLLLTTTPDARRELDLPLENWRDPLKLPWIPRAGSPHSDAQT
ncbi:MAG: hypothetical protein M3320_00600 [Actinomycetota bacterium]|nr:hypothetical protein [Actinomycetota bacterium]